MDQKKSAEEKERYERESNKLVTKLQLAESKKRFYEQIGRDDAHYVHVVSPMEFEEVRRECEELKSNVAALQDDVKQKDVSILQLTQDVASAQYNLQSSEHAKVKLTARVEELQKKENLTQERMVEIVNTCDAKIKAMDARVEEELRDARYKLKELAQLQKEKGRLVKKIEEMEEQERSVRTQSKEFMQQLSDARLRIASLEEQITDQEAEYARSLEDHERKVEVSMAQEVAAMNDRLRALDVENASLKKSAGLAEKLTKQVEELTLVLAEHEQSLREKDVNIANLTAQLGRTVNDPVAVESLSTERATFAQKPVDEGVMAQNEEPRVELREVKVVDTEAIETLKLSHEAEIKMWRTKHEALERAYNSLNEAVTDLRSLNDQPAFHAQEAKRLLSSARAHTEEEITIASIDEVQASDEEPVSEKETLPSLQVKQMILHQTSRDKIPKGAGTKPGVGGAAPISQPSQESLQGSSDGGKIVTTSAQTDPVYIGDRSAISEAGVQIKVELKSTYVQTEPIVSGDEPAVCDTSMTPQDSASPPQMQPVDSSHPAVTPPVAKNQSSLDIKEIKPSHTARSSARSSSGAKVAPAVVTNPTLTVQNSEEYMETENAHSAVPPLSCAEVMDIVKSTATLHIHTFSSGVSRTSLLDLVHGTADASNYIDNMVALLVDILHPDKSPMIRMAAATGDSDAIEEDVKNAVDMLTSGISQYQACAKAIPSTKSAARSNEEGDSDGDDPFPKHSDSTNDRKHRSIHQKYIEAGEIDRDDSVSVKSDITADDSDTDVVKPVEASSIDKDQRKRRREYGAADSGEDENVLISASNDIEIESVVDEPKKNDKHVDNIDSDADDATVEEEIERRLSRLSGYESEVKLRAAESEISRLNAELVELKLSHQSILDQLQRALGKSGDDDDYDGLGTGRGGSVVSEVSENSGKSSRVGFDASKFLAMASQDNHRVKKKTRAEILLEQSKAPQIDRSEASSPTKSSPTSHSFVPINRSMSCPEDDDISALDDDISLDFGLHRSASMEMVLSDGGGETTILHNERERIAELLSAEDAQAFGMIKSENFDRLRDGPFGGNDIVLLTRLEYYYKSLVEDAEHTSSETHSSSGSVVGMRPRGGAGSKLSHGPSSKKRVSARTRIQATAARIEVEAKRKLIVDKYPVKDLVRYLTVTESTLIKLNTFSVWKRMQHAASGGLFHDILVVHRDNLNRCIAEAGGYSQAMLNVQIENKLDDDTTFWPDFFRVKVLEYYRKELFSLSRLHTLEVEGLNAEIEKLRRDLSEEKELVIAERAWALKEISAMSVHLKKRLTMSRGSSMFLDMDLKDILPKEDDDDEAAGIPGIFVNPIRKSSSSLEDKDDSGNEKAEVLPPTEVGAKGLLRITSDDSDAPKERKKVAFAASDSSQAPRLYEENSAFYLKAKEIHRSLKAKTFFKKIINSRMMFSSFQKKKAESVDEFEEQLKQDAVKEINLPPEDDFEAEATKPMRPSQMLDKTSLPDRGVREEGPSDTDEDEEDDDKKSDSGDKQRDDSEEGGVATGDVEKDDDVELVEEGDEGSEEESEIGAMGLTKFPPKNVKKLVRQGSRKIERIVIDITKLQLQLQDIAVAVYKDKTEQAVLLAQALSSVLFNWEKVDTTHTSLDACMSLCRPDSADVECINSLKNFARSKSSNMELSDLMRSRDILLDCVQYYERIERILPRRQSSGASSIEGDNDTASTTTAASVPGRARAAAFRLEGGGTCGNCGAKVTLADLGSSPVATSSGNAKVLFSSPTTPNTSDEEGPSVVSRRRAKSQNSSPSNAKKRPSKDFVVKKKVSLPLEKAVVEEPIKLVDHKSCQTETNDEVVVSYQSPDEAPSIEATVNSQQAKSNDERLPPGLKDTLLVQLEEDVWDYITPHLSIIDAPFNQFGIEISPGIRLVSNYVKHLAEPVINPEDPDLPPLNEGETENVPLPHGVVLVRKRKQFTPLFKGIVEWNEWDSLKMQKPDLPEDIIAVEIPSVLDISPNVQLFGGGYLNFSIELPVNVWMLSLFIEQDSTATYFGELDSMIPEGCVMVRLAESLVVSKELNERLPVGVELVEINPHKLVQLNGRYATLPEGLILAPGIMLATAECAPPPGKEIAYFSFDKIKSAVSEGSVTIPADQEKNPPIVPLADDHGGQAADLSAGESKDGDVDKKDENLVPLVLPPGIVAVYVDEEAEWPSFLTKLKLEGESIEVPLDDVDISAQSDATVYLMKSSIVVLRTPDGLTLPPGGVLVKRPRSMNGLLRPLPPGMQLCPPSLIPERLTLRNGVELVLLNPIYELPAGIKITPDAVVYQRPVGMKIPCNSALVRRSPICTVPRDVAVGALPNVPFGVYLPSEVELWVFPHGLRLPVNTEIADGVVVAETPHIPTGQVLQDGVLFIKRQHWAMSTPLPPGMERALKQHLPKGCLLPSGVEAIFIRPRYELPAGIQLQTGVTLGRDIQLPPGSEVLSNIEVVEWPQGMYLPPNIELVRRIDRDVGLPSDVVLVQDSADEFKTIDTNRVICSPPRGCFLIRLPYRLDMPSIFDLIDRCMIIPMCPPGAPYADAMQELQRNLPKNVMAIKKVPPSKSIGKPLSLNGNIPLPPELTPYPDSLLPKDLHLPVGMELVYVHSHFDLPEGALLKGGFTVANRLQNLSISPELIPVVNKQTNPKDLPNDIVYPCQGLPSGHFGLLPGSMHDLVESWGLGLELLNPAEPPADMKKLPEGYFLIDLNKAGSHLDMLPPSLEIVNNVGSLPDGIHLPPQTIVVRLRPRIFLPLGIRVLDSCCVPVHMQFCPGEPLYETNVEVNYYPLGSSWDHTNVHVVRLDKQSIQEDKVDISTHVHRILPDRLANWFRNYRLSTIGVSVRGHGGYIQGKIPAPSNAFSSLAEIMRVPSRSLVSRGLSSRGSRAPLSKNSSRSLSVAEKDNTVSEVFNAGHAEDLLMANEQIEKLNDQLEAAYKEVRSLKRSVESGAKDLELSRAKYDRLESFRDNLMEELDRVRGSLDSIKAQEKKDETASRVKIMDLTAQTRNQAFTISEFQDSIKTLEDKIAYMRSHGGKSKNDLIREARLREKEIDAAREEAINEYRQLLKIACRTSYQLVLAIVSAAEKDRHLLTYSHHQNHQHVDHTEPFPPLGDDMSQITMDDDEVSLLSAPPDEESLSGVRSSVNRGGLRSASPSVTFNLGPTQEDSLSLSNSMPALRVGPTKNSRGSGMSASMSVGGNSVGDVNGKRMMGTGKKRIVKPVVKNFHNMPAVGVDETPIYAIAAALVDKANEDMSSVSSRKSLRSEGGSRSVNSLSHGGNVFMTTGTSKTSTFRRSVGTADAAKQRRKSTALDRAREFPQDSILALELVEPEVLKSSDYRLPTKLDITPADILPEKLIAALESTFTLSKSAIASNSGIASDKSTDAVVKSYVVDTAAADAVASEWLKTAVALSCNAIANTLGNYVSAFHLIESEIDSHIAERKRLHKKLKHAEGKYEDLVSVSDVPLEQRMQYRLDELNKSLVQMYSHAHNVRNMSHQPFLEVLRSQSTDISDLLEQKRRLELSAIVVRKKAHSEENRLKRGDFEEKERIAITHYVDSLRKRAQVLMYRAETVNNCCQDIAASVKTELEAFEGAVQNVMPPRIITKVLSWGISHTTKAVRDPQVSSNTGAVGAPPKPSLSSMQSLPLLKPSPSVPGVMVRKESDVTVSESDTVAAKKLPSVKADPFNRYFNTGNSGGGSGVGARMNVGGRSKV